MSDRNQKLRAVLTARAQVEAGDITAEQALNRIVWAMLEPTECKILGYIVQAQLVTATTINGKFGISLTHASTVLKQMADNGLLVRVEQVESYGRYFAYSPAGWIANV